MGYASARYYVSRHHAQRLRPSQCLVVLLNEPLDSEVFIQLFATAFILVELRSPVQLLVILQAIVSSLKYYKLFYWGLDYLKSQDYIV